MLVVAKAKEGGANFLEEHKIGVALRIGQSPTAIEPVLVHVDTMQIVVPAIEEETIGGVHIKGAKSQRLRLQIDYIRAAPYFDESLIQIGISQCIPQMRIGDDSGRHHV